MATYNYPSSVIENAPRTNVGLVRFNPYKYIDTEDEYFAPRDPRIKDYLNYSAYENVKGIPQLGIQDQLRRKQGGTYNTELNPYNPSSKFFPYEPDLTGIMGISAYEQGGKPVLQQDLGETSGLHDWSQTITINPFKHALKKDDKGVPQLELNPAQDPDKVRETLFHEGKHFFIDKFGKLIPKTGALSDEDEHKLIWFYEDMFTPGYEKKDFIWSLNKKQAEAWMEMQDLARKWSKHKTKFTGGRESAKEFWGELQNNPNLTEDQKDELYNERLGIYTEKKLRKDLWKKYKSYKESGYIKIRHKTSKKKENKYEEKQLNIKIQPKQGLKLDLPMVYKKEAQ